MDTLLEYALIYAELGWKMLPTKKDKHPLGGCKWREECTNKKEKLEEWFYKRPHVGIGIATEESNLFVLDLYYYFHPLPRKIDELAKCLRENQNHFE